MRIHSCIAIDGLLVLFVVFVSFVDKVVFFKSLHIAHQISTCAPNSITRLAGTR